MLACARQGPADPPWPAQRTPVPGPGHIVVTSIGVDGTSVTRVKSIVGSKSDLVSRVRLRTATTLASSSASSSGSGSSAASSSGSAYSSSAPSPTGGKQVPLTLGELQDMAVRQQQQLEVQHQLLSAREQRLHYLKHQGHALAGQDAERLQRLRERVEAQEQKLRKLRALRGQVDSNKLSNAALTSDLDSIRALFNEKEKELSLAVAKVEELTHQLEELRRGRQSAVQLQPSAASIELDKLRRELMYRNKLNDQQNVQLHQQRETLNKRQEEMNEIDRRISELQERLHRKRLLNQQLASQITSAPDTVNHQQHLRSSLNTNVQQPQQPSQQPPQQQPAGPLKGQKQPLHRPAVSVESHGEQDKVFYQAHGPVPVNAYLITTAQGHLMPSQHIQQQPELRFSSSQDDFHMKLQQRMAPHNVNNNLNNVNNNNLSSANNNKNSNNQVLFTKSGPNEDKDDLLMEFTGSKSDPKYQTLPYNTKFSPNSTSLAHSALMNTIKTQKSDSSSEESLKGNINNISVRGGQVPVSKITCGNDMQIQQPLNSSKASSSSSAISTSSSSNLQPKVYGLAPLSRGQPVGGALSTTSTSSAVTSITSSSQVGNVAEKKVTPSGPDSSPASETTVSSVSCIPSLVGPTNPIYSISSTNISTSDSVLHPVLTTSAILAPSKINYFSQLTRLPVEAGSVVLPPTPLTLANQQKPLSSLAVQHQKPSPIYQTSSMKIHPIQPQVLTSTPQGVLKDLKGDLSPPQSTSTPLGTPDLSADVCRGTVPKPALPPKPAVPIKPTPPPRQTQHLPSYMEGTASWLSESRVTQTNANWGAGHPPSESIRTSSMEATTEVNDCSTREGISISAKGSMIPSQQTQSSTESQSKSMNMLQSDEQQAEPDDVSLQHSTVNPPPPPPPPLTDPPEEVTSFSWRASGNQLSQVSSMNTDQSKPRGCSGTISSNSISFLNNNLSHGNGNNSTSSNLNSSNNFNNNSNNHNNNNNNSTSSIHMVSLSRRIEMPPAFLFPENEAPPADLVSNRDDSQGNAVVGQDEADRVIPVGTEDSLQNENNRHQLVSSDDTNKGNSKDSVVETMNNLNISGSPNSDECQPIISESKGDSPPLHILRRNKKGNLKSGKMTVTGSGSRRVSFDPLALLLDASLEGELELVRKTAGQVSNPSAANDEGITALHNAICAGHLDIVKFLVEFGCDVNAQDSDGWTPLHCAASCNNLAMVRFLVEHGACIFATTLSDHETAAEKCEEDEEGFDGCSEYLYSVQEKLGILNNGVVYAVFDYEAHNPDELSFREGEKLVVLRKGDEWEREWWWSRLNDQEGYVPRNLLGLYPRVRPKKISE